MKQNNKTFIFNDFENKLSKLSTKSELVPKLTYNISFKNNLIETSADFSDFFEQYIPKSQYDEFYNNNSSLLAECLKIFLYEFFDIASNSLITRVFALSKNFVLFEYNTSLNLFITTHFNTGGISKTFNKDGVLYLLTPSTLITIKSHNLYHSFNHINIDDFCVFDDNIFFNTPNNPCKLFYTENTELFNISNTLSGCYSFDFKIEDGLILKIFADEEAVYVIQQYKISKLVKKQKVYVISKETSLDFKTVKNSICKSDDYIILCSNQKIYIFDGNNIEELFNDISCSLKLNDCYGIIFDNNYYLKTKMLYDEIYEDVLIEFNIKSKTYTIYKIDGLDEVFVLKTSNTYNLCAICNVNYHNEFLTLNHNRISHFNKYLKFNKISFDSNILKYIKTIKFDCVGEFNFKISANGQIFNFYIFENNFEFQNLSIEGYVFEIELSSSKAFKINSIFFEIIEPVGDYD